MTREELEQMNQLIAQHKYPIVLTLLEHRKADFYVTWIRARCYIGQENFPLAYASLRLLPPTNVLVRITLAGYYEAIGDNDLALATYELIKDEEHNRASLLRFGRFLQEKIGDLKKSILIYKQYEHWESDVVFLKSVAYCFKELREPGSLQTAKNLYDRILDFKPGDETALGAKATCQQRIPKALCTVQFLKACVFASLGEAIQRL